MTPEISWLELAMGMTGGLALFLFGMEKLAQSLRAVAGDRMRAVLSILSSNRFAGLATGVVITAMVQSSSVTTVMLVGFVSASLMSLSQTIGVILGADIGTTVTAQLIAFKVTHYALLLVASGYLATLLVRQERHKDYGYVVMSLGLIFFGMAVMSDAMRPLRDYPPFLDLMVDMGNPLQGIAVGALFTAIIQSSGATMGVIIVLALQGVITLEGGIALALGANIGTCATAGLAAIGKPREAVRVAVAHVGFKIVGVLLVLPFISPFADFVASLSTPPEGLSGAELLAQTVPRQVANAHTLFNVGIAALFIPFTTQFARLITRLVPDRALREETAIIEARFLDPLLLETPGPALVAARQEIERLGRRSAGMFRDVLPALLDGPDERLADIERRDEEVDALYGRIVTFLGELSKLRLHSRQTAELLELMAVANHLETIGDLVQDDLVDLGRKRVRDQLVISDATRAKLLALHAHVADQLDAAVRAVVNEDPALRNQVRAGKTEMERLLASASAHQAARLVADAPQRLEVYALETEIIDRMHRIYYHARRLPKGVRHGGHSPADDAAA